VSGIDQRQCISERAPQRVVLATDLTPLAIAPCSSPLVCGLRQSSRSAIRGGVPEHKFFLECRGSVLAANHLRTHYRAPAILIGHSLGGAAVLAAAHHIPEAKAVVTIGAPSDVAHVLHHFQAHLDDIERDGVASVTLAGRSFPISRRLVEDAKGQAIEHHVASLRKALLVMHASRDQTVGIEHTTAIFTTAKHPKSFVSLDSADHLLSDGLDAAYAAEVLAVWASRYVPQHEENAGEDGMKAS
jgi:fermentation-respiration switch protein FrsA (DUF1100 family)